MDYQSLKKRYIGLDLLRVISALVVCAFHTAIGLGADYGILQPVIHMGAVFMTAFFMLSGFSLFVNYAGKDIIQKECLWPFWIKRLIGIVPMYYVAALLFVLYKTLTASTPGTIIMQNIWLAPIEALGIQSNFSTLFFHTHNGGTWFISCILMCYLAYPLMQEAVKQLSLKGKITVIVLCSLILLYSPLVVKKFQTASIYSVPFFRMLEFLIGVTLASLKPELDGKSFVKKYVCCWWSLAVVSLLMMAGITVAVKLGIAVGNYMVYNWICLPCFIFLLYGLSGIQAKRLEGSRLLPYCSAVTFPFFLAQLLSNDISRSVIKEYSITNNWVIILVGWGICILIAIGLHELIEKPISRKLKKQFVK